MLVGSLQVNRLIAQPVTTGPRRNGWLPFGCRVPIGHANDFALNFYGNISAKSEYKDAGHYGHGQQYFYLPAAADKGRRGTMSKEIGLTTLFWPALCSWHGPGDDRMDR